MSIVKFKARTSKRIVFCIVDNTRDILDPWAREIIKNQADKTVQQLYGLDYDVFVGTNEDQLLQTVATSYSHACVISTGTEFIGDTALNELDRMYHDVNFICGHILDRGEAYYELHKQFYIINLKAYQEMGRPEIGGEILGESHTQTIPIRSHESVHDDYVPLWLQPGLQKREYAHKLHGWNILRVALSKYKLMTVPDKIRTGKVFMYPESRKDFNKMMDRAYHRERLCSNGFITKKNTERLNPLNGRVFDQIVIPASGTNYMENLNDDGHVVFYDYNQATLDYWKSTYLDHNYDFVLTDLLSEGFTDLEKYLDPNKTVFFNLSNIFVYEGTALMTPLSHRLYRENVVMDQIMNFNPNAYINFTARSSTPFVKDATYMGPVKDMERFQLKDLVEPTWHTGNWR